MSAILVVIVGLVGLLVGAAAGYLVRRRSVGTALLQTEEQSRRILSEAESKQKELILEAKEEALKVRNTLDGELRERRTEVTRLRLTSEMESTRFITRQAAPSMPSTTIRLPRQPI